ncbi:acylphosphatase [Tardiphaga sp. 709]|uniref:acylphosphatase n=1 Tax=unclassified Tardiphaga TaxID=2631404 RepID=UPI0028EE9D59|nr:acylphosphatase [Tardiphaga sp. 709]WNV09502.1 acylphosphatase [Tardiphaga sp. 709]
MSDVIRHVMILGRVQGVGYRYWTGQQASLLGLEGWVRNRRDGSVEAVFAGPADIVTDMIEACRRGPTAARVDSVVTSDATPDMLALRVNGEVFSQLPTL